MCPSNHSIFVPVNTVCYGHCVFKLVIATYLSVVSDFLLFAMYLITATRGSPKRLEKLTVVQATVHCTNENQMFPCLLTLSIVLLTQAGGLSPAQS